MESAVEKTTDVAESTKEADAVSQLCFDVLTKAGYAVVTGRVAMAVKEDVGMVVSVASDDGGPRIEFILCPDGHWTSAK